MRIRTHVSKPLNLRKISVKGTRIGSTTLLFLCLTRPEATTLFGRIDHLPVQSLDPAEVRCRRVIDGPLAGRLHLQSHTGKRCLERENDITADCF